MLHHAGAATRRTTRASGRSRRPLDEGETAERDALRELQEEVGLTLDESPARRADDYAPGGLIKPRVVWADPHGSSEPRGGGQIFHVPLDDLEGPDVRAFIRFPKRPPRDPASLLAPWIQRRRAVLYQSRGVVHGRRRA